MTEPTPTYAPTVSIAAALLRKQRAVDEVERIVNNLSELSQQARTMLVGWDAADDREQNRRYADVRDLRLRLDAILATEEG